VTGKLGVQPVEDNFKLLLRHWLAVNADYKDTNIDHWAG
jgi:hypothetical protein